VVTVQEEKLNEETDNDGEHWRLGELLFKARYINPLLIDRLITKRIARTHFGIQYNEKQ